MRNAVLVLNTGSSSIKFAVYIAGAELRAGWRGQIEGIGAGGARLVAQNALGERITHSVDGSEHRAAMHELLTWLATQLEGVSLHAAGHRVVHGGTDFSAPVIVSPDDLRALHALCPLAPLHQPHNLHGIEAVLQTYPQLPQVACFDTAFHRSMPEVAQLFALPARYTEAGIRRYGFHGLSYESIAGMLPAYLGAQADGRVVVAHLGHGASLCALRQRTSIETTMSFSPLDGIPMATRSGSLDPSAVLFLQREMDLDVNDVADLLNSRAGLLGVSGASGDMRALLADGGGDARRAVALFVYHVVRAIGSLSAALGGLDALVFTAGIGEHAAAVREQICRDCGWLGIALDPRANARHGPCISRPDSRVSAWVISTNEELMIARHALKLVPVTLNG